ncbi:hypothetical protein SEPL_494 [Salmonella phage SE_PL]|nr:hypothetical protein 7t3_056 [Salmonella phage 7t3]QIG63107.1 hypothetical protein SEPL_494 [Salmonella phage SE_PL]
MFTKFHNVSFITSTVTGLEVEGNHLVIHTTGSSYEVPFKSGAEAKSGLDELTDILNNKNINTNKKEETASKTDDILNLAQEAVESLQGVLGTLRSAATSKVADVAVQKVLDRIDGRLSSVLDAKDDLIAKAKSIFEHAEPENKPKAQPKTKEKSVVKEPKNSDVPVGDNIFGDILNDIFTGTSCVDVSHEHGAKKITVDEFKQVFGTESEPLIGDLTDKQLREFISEFVDGALENERVQVLFNNIKEQFGVEEAEKAIEGYKKLIHTFCNQNVEMTLSQVIARYFS